MANPDWYVYRLEKKVGWDGLTEPQKLLSSAYRYDYEATSGGHEEYFSNWYGYQWFYAVAGLEAIGAPRRAKILAQALGVFPPEGPPHSEDDRRRFIYRMSKEQQERWTSLDRQYSEMETESVAVLIALYAVKHATHFRDSAVQD